MDVDDTRNVFATNADSSSGSNAVARHHNRIPMSSLQDYELYNQLGQGTFGIVTKARQKKSHRLVALKKFLVTDKKEGFPITAFREITIMKKLKNIHILQIIDMIYEPEGSFFYTVSPYISSDLNGLINNPRIDFSLPQIKCLMKQILQGINYVHQKGYLHRDIKTANILLDKFGVVKIADFGLARLFHGNAPITANSPPGGGLYEYTGLVVTRWYRPPELLLGDTKYTTAVDMWGVGCVFGEFFVKRPILEGKSDIHQAEIIFKLLGSPTPENFPNAHLINRHNIDLKHNYSRTLESMFGKYMNPDAVSLLSGMLTLNPQRRYNALKALDSTFFKNDPLPCKEDQLANLEESHESDVKRFKDEKTQNFQNKPVNSSHPIRHINNTYNPNNNSGTNSLNHSKYGADDPALMNRSESTANMSNNYPSQVRYAPRDYHRGPYSRDYKDYYGEQSRDYSREYSREYPSEGYRNQNRDYATYEDPRNGQYDKHGEDPRYYNREYQNDSQNYYSRSYSEEERVHHGEYNHPPQPPPHASSGAPQAESFEDAGHQTQSSYLRRNQLIQIQKHMQNNSGPKRTHRLARRSQYEFIGSYPDDRYDATRRDDMFYERQPMSASKRLKSLEPPVDKFSSLAGGKDLYGGDTGSGLSFLSKVIKENRQGGELKKPSLASKEGDDKKENK